MWYGATYWMPDAALGFTQGAVGNFDPHMFLLSSGKVCVNWVQYDTTNTEYSKFNAAVGTISAGSFIPDAQYVLKSCTEVPAGSDGRSRGYQDAAGYLCIEATLYGSTTTTYLARATPDLSTRVVRVVSSWLVDQGPILVSFGGVLYTFEKASSTSVRVSLLDSSLNVVSYTDFTVADATLFGDPIVSGSYVSFGGLMASYNGSTVDDVWTRTATTGAITAAVPGGFVANAVSGGIWTGGFNTITFSGRTETFGPLVLRSGTEAIYDPAQTVSGDVWTFYTGSGD